MNMREAFAAQLAKSRPLDDAYFNLTDEHRQRLTDDNPLKNSDEQWELFKKNRLLTEFDTRKKIGDIMLYAIVIESKGDDTGLTISKRVIDLIERELSQLELNWQVVSDSHLSKVMPVLCRKSDKITLAAATGPAQQPVAPNSGPEP